MVKPRSDIETGRKYGWLIVLGPAEKNKTGHICWTVRCRCGREYAVPTGILNKGTSKCREYAERNRKTGKRRVHPGDVVGCFEVLSDAGGSEPGIICMSANA